MMSKHVFDCLIIALTFACQMFLGQMALVCFCFMYVWFLDCCLDEQFEYVIFVLWGI